MDGLTQRNLDGLSPVKHCRYKIQCSSFYNKDCTSECHLLTDLKLNIFPDFIKPKTAGKITYACPRDKSIPILDKCNNRNCIYFNPKMAANCLHLHSTVFNKDLVELLSVSFNLDKIYFERGMKMVMYSYRLYIVLIAYMILTDYDNIECIPNKEEIKNYIESLIGNNKEWILETQNSEQTLFNTLWLYELQIERTNIDLNSIGYKKYFHEYHKFKNKLSVLKQIIYTTEIRQFKLTNVPLLFLTRCYYSLFGSIDITNFGMTDRKGKKLISLYLGD